MFWVDGGLPDRLKFRSISPVNGSLSLSISARRSPARVHSGDAFAVGLSLSRMTDPGLLCPSMLQWQRLKKAATGNEFLERMAATIF